MRAFIRPNRRSTIKGVFSAGAILAAPAILRAQDMGEALAESAQGKLRRVRSPGLSTFKGIPYAGSVSGPDRFKAQLRKISRVSGMRSWSL